WGKCAPWRMRMPLPWLAVAAVSGIVLRGNAGLAALLLCPAALGKPGKMGCWGFSVVIGAFLFFVPCLLAMKRRAATAPSRFWSFRSRQGRWLGDAGGGVRTRAAGLPVSVYALRRGGALGDLLACRRQGFDVQQRGGWASDENFRRCANQAGITSELQRAGPAVAARGQERGALLAGIVLNE
ncbi:unnamed protein product, partial [Prorocentrum cordatum]